VFFAYGPRAYGISGYSFNGDVSVTNSGTVEPLPPTPIPPSPAWSRTASTPARSLATSR
jgi:hypothetical protein